MSIFNINFCDKYDNQKPSLLFCDLSRRLNDNNLFLTRFMLNTAEILSNNFNVFWIVETKTGKSIQNIQKEYNMINFIYSNVDEFKFFNHEVDNYIQKNNQMVINTIKTELKEISNITGLIIKPAILLSGPGGDNEFYDEIDSEKITPKLLKQIESLNNQIQNKTTYAYTAYMTKFTRVIMDVVEYYQIENNAKIYQFIIDPASYCMYFNDKYNAKTLYFENDFRGTRKFNEFPMGQLNYFYNYKFNCNNFEDKNNLFIWGGLALFQKGDRMQDYHKFIKNFRYEKSSLHISKTNSIKSSKKPKHSKILLNHPLFESTFNSIQEHPLNLDLIANNLFEEKLEDHKYTLILKCISKNDSLNFRIFYSLLFNMIPFIANNYDPNNIQIPEKFYSKLRVSSNIDIENKITYFETNKDEAINFLNELKNYYVNNKFNDKNWYLEQFKNNYFKELYEK